MRIWKNYNIGPFGGFSKGVCSKFIDRNLVHGMDSSNVYHIG